VFEASIKRICKIVHQHGGQVYMDGANMTRRWALPARRHRRRRVPPEPPQDVLHPHGRGGPGMAHRRRRASGGHLADASGIDVGVRSPKAPATVSAGPWGSPSILPISWAYIAMMGRDGLTLATKVAILNANYIARRLQDGGHYELLYAGQHGLVGA